MQCTALLNLVDFCSTSMQFVVLFHQDWVFGLCKAHKEEHQNCKRRSIWETTIKKIEIFKRFFFFVVGNAVTWLNLANSQTKLTERNKYIK